MNRERQHDWARNSLGPVQPERTAAERPLYVGYRRRKREIPGRLEVFGVAACLALAGCQEPRQSPSFSREDQFGRTYYIDGAGDWGFGVTEVPRGLHRAGYRGRVVRFRWSPFLNPALDQTIGRTAARAKGKELAVQICDYLTAFPDNEVNIIALSAGTGVATWACENLRPPAKVNNLVLLGSSLSAAYDMRPALKNIVGGVYVYHSRRDSILQGPVRVLGTIDGKLGVDAAGIVGLQPSGGIASRIHNVPWSARYQPYGWSGAHTDIASETFAYRVLISHVIPRPTSEITKASRGTGSDIAASDQENTRVPEANSI